MMQLVFARDARADLAEILHYIAQDSPRSAAVMLARIDGVIQRLAAGELHGPEVRLLDGRRLQTWSVSPYRISYRRTARRTVIVRVYHQSRRPIERRRS